MGFGGLKIQSSLSTARVRLSERWEKRADFSLASPEEFTPSGGFSDSNLIKWVMQLCNFEKKLWFGQMLFGQKLRRRRLLLRLRLDVGKKNELGSRKRKVSARKKSPWVSRTEMTTFTSRQKPIRPSYNEWAGPKRGEGNNQWVITSSVARLVLSYFSATLALQWRHRLVHYGR